MCGVCGESMWCMCGVCMSGVCMCGVRMRGMCGVRGAWMWCVNVIWYVVYVYGVCMCGVYGLCKLNHAWVSK